MATQRAFTGEIPSLTSIRGVAALWVILLHFLKFIERCLPEVAIASPLVGCGDFAVALFFILSGYVIGLRYLPELRRPTWRSMLTFWRLRLNRIYPVHLLSLLASLALITRNGWPSDAGHTVSGFWASVALVHAWGYRFHLTWNYPSWSVSSEWFVYLLFPIFAYFLGRIGRRATTAVALASVCAGAGAYMLGSSIPFYGLAVAVPTFLGGVALSALLPPSGSRGAGIVANVACLAVPTVPYFVASESLQAAAFITLFFAIVAALGHAGQAAGKFWAFRPLLFLGNISYAVYMTHLTTVSLIFRYFPMDRVSEASLAVRAFAIFAALFAQVGVGALVYYAFERPLRDWSKRRIRGVAAGAR